MPRRSVLSLSERESLLAMPETDDQLIRHYTLSERDLSLIRQHRGAANRLGFAVQLCYMRYPGVALGAGETPYPALLQLVGTQVKVPAEAWTEYGHRDQTRREHQIELQSIYGFQPFLLQHYRRALQDLDGLAEQTDKGFLLATALVDSLRSHAILLPSINVIERLCAESVTRGNRRIFRVLTESLSQIHRACTGRIAKTSARRQPHGHGVVAPIPCRTERKTSAGTHRPTQSAGST